VKPGTKLVSAVGAAQVVVVRPPKGSVTITCEGVAMAEFSSAERRTAAAAGQATAGVVLGKRYADAGSGLEVLCVHAGAGPLAVDGREMSVKLAKPLPSSD